MTETDSFQVPSKDEGMSRYNSIFRNQPNYKYFSKTFGDDPFDSLFLTLNDLDSGFLEQKEIIDKRGFSNDVLVDPRTNKPIRKYIYDYTQEARPKIFHSPKPSDLNKQQHNLGVRILKARNEGLEVGKNDLLHWQKLEALRIKESQEFAKFLYEYNQTKKELIYAPTRRLIIEYKKWYNAKCKRLLSRYPDESYNTHLGLPHVKMCKAVLKEQCAEIVEVNILNQKAENLKCNDLINDIDFSNIQRSLEIFSENYISTEHINDLLEDEMKGESLKIIEKEDPQLPLYFIPMETLLFLLIGGDYCDLPMEVLLDIKEHKNGPKDTEKYIVMDTPLPARYLGWHTYKQVVEQASVALVSVYNRRHESVNTSNTSVKMSHSPMFPAVTISEYMKKYPKKSNGVCKFSKTLSRWQLKASDNNISKHIFTTSDTSPEGSEPFSLKLEYKPSFGCEIMTKYELLKEWFKLKLQQFSKSMCYRLDINNFETALKESQNLTKLELLLRTIYHVQMPVLLNSLYEFLTLLSSMPPGQKYMLRYNPKFKDKLMLCKPSKEITSNTLHLHQLLNKTPSELLFMSQQSYLPIADDLCSRVHIYHNILPCSFAPSDYSKAMKKRQTTFKLLNDKETILEKAKNKRISESKRGRPVNKKHKKRAQRARRTQRRVAEKEREKKQQELEREMFMY